MPKTNTRPTEPDLRCSVCHGEGTLGDDICPLCDGNGQLTLLSEPEGDDASVLDDEKSTARGRSTKVCGDTEHVHAPFGEAEELRAQLAEANARIAELEGQLADRSSQQRRPARAKTHAFLQTLKKSQLLDKRGFQRAVSLADDVKPLACRLIEAGLLTEWQAAQLAAGRTSLFLGKYKLVRMLGHGEIGNVFLAEHITLNRRAMIKVVSSKLSADPKSLKQLLDEAQTLAELEHPNIIGAYSVDRLGKRYYLVMEYIDGQNLDQLAADGNLNYRKAADYVRQAAVGLQHGHDNEVLHGDVKPANLWLDESGVVKIAEMGLRSLRDPEHLDTSSRDDSRMLASIDYLAPEQFSGKTACDGRADVYSLGCTLYYLLAGQPPFAEGLLHERLMMHQSMQPTDIRSIRPDVPDDLALICQKMMAKDPADRYSCASAVAQDLRRFLAKIA